MLKSYFAIYLYHFYFQLRTNLYIFSILVINFNEPGKEYGKLFKRFEF